MVNVVACTFEHRQLNFVYKKRREFDQAVSLGRFIKQLEPTIPGGILIFFASYEMMQFILSAWDHQ